MIFHKTIRILRRTMVVTLLCGGLAFAQETEFIDLFPRQDHIACYRIPAIVSAPNGDLVAVIDERIPSCADLRDNKNINIVGRRSSDNGKTWTPIQTIVDYPEGQSASDPSMIVDRDTQTIFMFFNYMDLDRESQIYYLKYVKSRNNGKTWSQPVDITDQVSKSQWHHDFKFITSGRGIQTREGTLLHTLVNLNNGLHLFKSDDHGSSWQLIDYPLIPGDESKVVQAGDGSWMVNSRVNQKGFRQIHRSADQGKTWTTYRDDQLVDPACNAGIIRWTPDPQNLNPGYLLFVNANHPTDRKNLTLRISKDDGKTWPISQTIYTGSAAYAAICLLENNDLGVFFEKDDYTQNAFIRLSREQILALLQNY
jgi:sialidase-1